jgi:hypothetical protein
MMTDPIADMLTRIRIAITVERPHVDIPLSHVKRGWRKSSNVRATSGIGRRSMANRQIVADRIEIWSQRRESDSPRKAG